VSVCRTNLATVESTNFINKTIEREKKYISGDGDCQAALFLSKLVAEMCV